MSDPIEENSQDTEAPGEDVKELM